MNRMIGRGRGLHLVDHGPQPLLELALHGGAGLHQADVERAQAHAPQRGRHVARRDALRQPLHHRGLADAGLAGEDRVVLAAAHQHVDDLADLLVAAADRVHRARRGARGQVLREAVERGRSPAPRRLRRGARRSAPRRPEPSTGRRLSSIEVPRMRSKPSVRASIADLLPLGRDGVERGAQLVGQQHTHQDVAGADLRLAEQQRGIVPAPVERVEQRLRDHGQLRPVASSFSMTRVVSTVSRARSSLKWSAARSRSVPRAAARDAANGPARHGCCAPPWPVASLREGVVSHAVELARHGLEADIGHARSPWPAMAVCSRRCRACSAGLNRASQRCGLRGGPVGREPSGPADLAEAAGPRRKVPSARHVERAATAARVIAPPEPRRQYLRAREGQFDLPVERFADVEDDEVDERPAAVAARQEAPVLLHVPHSEADSELVLDAEAARAEDHVLAEAALAAPIRVRSPRSRSRRVSANSSISTATPNSPRTRPRRRDALWSGGRSGPRSSACRRPAPHRGPGTRRCRGPSSSPHRLRTDRPRAGRAARSAVRRPRPGRTAEGSGRSGDRRSAGKRRPPARRASSAPPRWWRAAARPAAP